MPPRPLVSLLTAAVLLPPAAAAPKPRPKKSPAKPPAAAAKLKPGTAMAFSPAELDLAPGETYLTQLIVPSPTGHAFKGKLTFSPSTGLKVREDTRWTGRVPPWGVKLYPKVTAAADAEGELPVEVSLEKGGKARLMVHVHPPQIEVVPGHKRLAVKVTSPFKTRPLVGRVMVSNPDRFLQDITSLEFKVAPGQTQELVFPLPGAAPAESEMYDFTVKVQTYQGYKDEQTHRLSFPPQEIK